MTKFSNKLKKPCFWPISDPFAQFGGKKIFPENPALSHPASHGILAPCQILEKTNDATPRKRLDRRKDRPHFIALFWLPPGVQKETLAGAFLLILWNF